MGQSSVRSDFECDAATTVVCIEHASAELTTILLGLRHRPFRLMAWTNEQVSGWPRHSDAQWTRLTMDDLTHVATRGRPDGWVSCVASAEARPIVDVAEVFQPN